MPEAKTLNLYSKLSAPFPEKAIQRATKEETKKGYDTTGIGYAFCVDRLNEVKGLEGWGFDWEIIKEIKGTWRNGSVNFEIAVKVSVWIGNSDNVRSCAGSHLASSYGDALKGAITNAFKKTAAFWGVGRQAYEGTLDEDYRPREQGEDSRVTADAEQKKPDQSLIDELKAMAKGTKYESKLNDALKKNPSQEDLVTYKNRLKELLEKGKEK